MIRNYPFHKNAQPLIDVMNKAETDELFNKKPSVSMGKATRSVLLHD